MASWKIRDGHIRPLSELSDSLERDLAGLESSIMALDFDAVVRDNTRENNRPHSVDAFCTNGRGLYYIEFKAERKESMDEISEGYRSKAHGIASPVRQIPVDKSRMLQGADHSHPGFTRCIGSRPDAEQLQASAEAIGEAVRRRQKRPEVYYDRISYWPCRRFVDYANRNMTNSDAAGVKTMLCREQHDGA